MMVVMGIPALAQEPTRPTPPPRDTFWQRATSSYRAPSVAAPSFSNSSRASVLVRAGNLYLSLPDAIALALENNLDLEWQRSAPAIADTDILRASGGGLLRGLNLTVTEAPPGIGGPGAPLITAAATGAIGGSTIVTNVQDLQELAGTQTSLSITGTSALSSGPPIPAFDPAIVGQLNWLHQEVPQTSPTVAGANALVMRNTLGSIGLEKGFSLGTQVNANFNATGQTTNSLRSAYNPYSTSFFGFSVVQPLLRGFGPGVNRRFVRIARNDRAISDLVFRQQVIATVSGVIRLYYDLVSLGEDFKVRQQTLALAERLYEDNKSQVELGTLAPIELVRAQAQVAAARQDLANSEGFVLQQELILKNVLTRSGNADPMIRQVRIVPTSPITIPTTDDIAPEQDLVAEAVRKRPEVAAAGLQIQNSLISLEGSRNELLPELDLVGSVQGSGLAGQLNPAATQNPVGGIVSTPAPAVPDLSTVGGLGTALGQVFGARYPTYSVGLQLTLPVRNRVAQADIARDELQVHQTEIRERQIDNQVRLEVEAALIALRRSRAAYEAAVQSRTLQEQSLSIEQEKYAVGLSTNFLVIQYQSFLAQARSTEVAARSAYVKARTALERATGRTLEDNNVSIDEAYAGSVSRAPEPPPATPLR
jgi:outer membrane protein TolC